MRRDTGLVKMMALVIQIRDASDGHYNDDDIDAAQTRGESGAAACSSHLTLPVAEAAEAQV